MLSAARLDAAYLTLIAALGLELGCIGRPASDADSETTDEADSSTGDGDGDQPEPFECENPTPILQAGTEIPSGFVKCENGFVHRVEPVECVNPQSEDSPDCTDPNGGCVSGDDCTDQPYGSCRFNPEAGCSCRYGCATDDDCGTGQICACPGVVGAHARCISAECGTGDDCGEGLCGLSTHHGVCDNSYELACTTSSDECHVDAECVEAPCPDFPEGMVPYYCEGTAGEGFSCQPSPNCDGVCGRPLLVEGHARLAAAIARGDWSCATAIDSIERIEPATRRRLAEHWTQIGRFEHASVASFARFATHLLRLGAPPRLLRETAIAKADEIVHARLAFGLASAYADAQLGPGPLDVRNSIDLELDRYAIVDALIHEACVGETIAAIEAQEAAAHASDPAVAAVLERIAADELRHAALGWGSLRWMLERGDERLRRFALARLDAALAEVMAAVVEDGVPANLREHGLLDDVLRTHVRRRCVVELIEPCVVALRRWHASSERLAAAT